MAKDLVVRVPFYVKRFVAGSQPEDGVFAACQLQRSNISSTLDLLGENVTDVARSKAFTETYIELLDMMHKKNLSPAISVKLTMLGLDLDSALCFENISKV